MKPSEGTTMPTTENIEIAIYPEVIPQALRNLPQWVIWKTEDRNGKSTKGPFNPKTKTLASTTNPRTWSDFNTACHVFKQGGYDGVGFVFTDTDPFCGIDLDKCREPDTGIIEPWAQAIIDELKSYTEISPSGQGLHIIIESQLPEGQRRRGQFETYESGRYFTMTGHHLDGTPDCIHNRQAEMEDLHAEVFGSRENAQSTSHTGKSTSRISDDEVLTRARKSKNADKFERLWSGDWTEYDSQSEGDLALCSMLAFWTKGTAEQIDRLFRQSRLFREKWDEKHFSDGRTYGEATIAKALLNVGTTMDATDNRAHGEKSWPQMDEAAFHGLAGDIVRALEPHTEADPVGLVGHLLSEFSALVGTGPRIKVGGGSMPLIFNAVFVGQTSKARKGTAEKEVRYVVHKAIPEWTRGECRGNLSSGEGLVWAVRDADGDDPGIKDKRLFLVQAEYGSVLKVMGREGNSLSGVIRDCWDGESLMPMTKNSRIKATKPHIVIAGHVTEEELKKHLTSTEACNGFGNRFAWFMVRRSKALSRPTEPDERTMSPLLKRLKEVVTLGKQSRYLKMSNLALEEWDAVYPDLSEGRSGMVGALIGRAEAQVLRLAGLYALLDKLNYVKRVHLEAALALWQYVEDSVEYIFGNAIGDEIGDKILNEIRRYGQLTDSGISALFKRNVSAVRLESAKRFLQDLELIESEMIESGGRPVRVWRVKLR